MFKVFLVRVITVCLLLVSLEPLTAQTTTGSIVGTVTDHSGAAVPGAAVTVTNVDTNSTTKTTTDSSGNYVVTPLPVGHYSVDVEARGFKRSLSEGITLNVQDRLGVNVALEVGQISETVEVTAATPALQTDTSYLGQVMESQKIVDLPLNGRYFTRLAVFHGRLHTDRSPVPAMSARGALAPMVCGRTRITICSTASITTACPRT